MAFERYTSVFSLLAEINKRPAVVGYPWLKRFYSCCAGSMIKQHCISPFLACLHNSIYCAKMQKIGVSKKAWGCEHEEHIQVLSGSN